MREPVPPTRVFFGGFGGRFLRQRPRPTTEPSARVSVSASSAKSLRVLLCLTSLDPTQEGRGGIAAVNRNVVRALHEIAGERCEIHTRALVYHGGAQQLRSEYFQG